jgi:endonuclease YncB( thermonuclease family)
MGTVCAAIVCVASLCAAAVPAQTVSGRVVAVHDGDTVTIREAARTVRVRLADIDCPELGQPYSERAKAFTSTLLFGKAVTLEARGLDQYERVIGRVSADGVDASAALVKAGLAWVYTRGLADRELTELEREARTRRAGLWADTDPVPPWSWRHAHESKTPGVSPPHQRSDLMVRMDVRDARGPFHGNTQSRVFHRLGCPRYNCKHCDEAFLSVDSAIEAGYRPAGDCFKMN